MLVEKSDVVVLGQATRQQGDYTRCGAGLCGIRILPNLRVAEKGVDLRAGLSGVAVERQMVGAQRVDADEDNVVALRGVISGDRGFLLGKEKVDGHERGAGAGHEGDQKQDQMLLPLQNFYAPVLFRQTSRTGDRRSRTPGIGTALAANPVEPTVLTGEGP